MVQWGKRIRRFRLRSRTMDTCFLRVLLRVAIFSFVIFELLLKYHGPDCITFDCLVFNLSDVRKPVLWTEAPATSLNKLAATSHKLAAATSHQQLADTSHKQPAATSELAVKRAGSEQEPDLGALSGEERAALARSRCREVYGEQPGPENLQYPFENRVFLANKERMAYCAVAKAFSSNIKRVIMYLARADRDLEKLKKDISPIEKIIYPHQKNFWPNSTVLKDFSREGQAQLLKDYYKFVFVRDPILKAISAYRDKFFSKTDDTFHNFFRHATARYICVAMAKYREREDANKFLKSATIDCSRSPSYMDLQAFLAWTFLVPDKFKPHDRDNLNPHWAPSIPICRICHPTVNYSFIGHFEKGLRDVYAIFDRAKWPFPFPSVSDTQISEEEGLEFKKEVGLLPRELMKELNQAMAAERYILGYTNEIPPIIGDKDSGN